MDQEFITSLEDFLASHDIDVYNEAQFASDRYRFDAIFSKPLNELELKIKLLKAIDGYNKESIDYKAKLDRISTKEVSNNDIDFTFDLSYQKK